MLGECCPSCSRCGRARRRKETGGIALTLSIALSASYLVTPYWLRRVWTPHRPHATATTRRLRAQLSRRFRPAGAAQTTAPEPHKTERGAADYRRACRANRTRARAVHRVVHGAPAERRYASAVRRGGGCGSLSAAGVWWGRARRSPTVVRRGTRSGDSREAAERGRDRC